MNYAVQIEGEAILRCSVYGPEVDPFLAFVVLLLGCEGADGSTTFTDESPALHGNASVFGTAQIDTASFPFGTSSLLTNAVGDAAGLGYPQHTDWDLSDANSDEYVVEGWVQANTATPTDSVIIGNFEGGVPNLSWALYVNTTGNGELEFLGTTSGGSFNWSSHPVSSGLSWVPGTWYYVRSDKDANGKCRLYRAELGDAIAPMIGSATPADSSLHPSAGILGLACQSTGGGRTWPGRWKEFRITKGASRNASDAGVPVPTGPFPRV